MSRTGTGLDSVEYMLSTRYGYQQPRSDRNKIKRFVPRPRFAWNYAPFTYPTHVYGAAVCSLTVLTWGMKKGGFLCRCETVAAMWTQWPSPEAAAAQVWKILSLSCLSFRL